MTVEQLSTLASCAGWFIWRGIPRGRTTAHTTDKQRLSQELLSWRFSFTNWILDDISRTLNLFLYLYRGTMRNSVISSNSATRNPLQRGEEKTTGRFCSAFSQRDDKKIANSGWCLLVEWQYVSIRRWSYFLICICKWYVMNSYIMLPLILTN